MPSTGFEKKRMAATPHMAFLQLTSLRSSTKSVKVSAQAVEAHTARLLPQDCVIKASMRFLSSARRKTAHSLLLKT